MVKTEKNRAGIQLTDGANMTWTGADRGSNSSLQTSTGLRQQGKSEQVFPEWIQDAESCWPRPGLAQGLGGSNSKGLLLEKMDVREEGDFERTSGDKINPFTFFF